MVMAATAGAQDTLKASLEATYGNWRNAMIRKDANAWQRVTAEHRRVEVRNRIVSEKLPFPGAIFNLPAPPPALTGLRFLEAKQNGATAKSSYFGKVDFGVGGEPTDNLLVLSFVKEGAGWLYDRADFVNLTGLPAVRTELAGGELKYLKETPEAQPSGIVPPVPVSANPAKYVAKVYVFCPGREVKVQINRISHHRFANAKEAEVVIGGASDGMNEVQYAIKPLEGGTGKEAMTIRVYLRSEAAGADPVKIFQYQIAEGEAVKPFGTERFDVTPAVAASVGRK